MPFGKFNKWSRKDLCHGRPKVIFRILIIPVSSQMVLKLHSRATNTLHVSCIHFRITLGRGICVHRYWQILQDFFFCHFQQMDSAFNRNSSFLKPCICKFYYQGVFHLNYFSLEESYFLLLLLYSLSYSVSPVVLPAPLHTSHSWKISKYVISYYAILKQNVIQVNQ